MQGENDNPAMAYGADEAGDAFALSRVALFAPALVIGAGYGAAWGWLVLRGAGASSLAHLCLVVLALGLPLILAHGLLRFFTFQLKPMVHAVALQPGFPRSGVFELPYGAIRRIDLKRGPGGWITGSGTLVFTLFSGEVLAASGLKHPQKALKLIGQAARKHMRMSGKPDLGDEPFKVAANGRI